MKLDTCMRIIPLRIPCRVKSIYLLKAPERVGSKVINILTFDLAIAVATLPVVLEQ